MPVRKLIAEFNKAKQMKELEKSEAAKDYFAMAEKRGNYAFDHWQKESDRLLKKAVGRKLGIFKTKEGMALEEFMRLARNETMKAGSAKTNLERHPRVVQAALDNAAVRYLLKANSNGERLEQIQTEPNGSVRVLIRDNSGRLRTETHNPATGMAGELNRLFARDEQVITPKQLGLADSITLKEYIEKKHKLKLNKKMQDKLNQISRLAPAYGNA